MLSINAKEFARVAGIAASAIDTRTSNIKPILGQVLVEAKKTAAQFTGANLETFVRVECECDAVKPVAVLMHASKLTAWLALRGDEVVHVSETKAGVQLACGLAKIVMPSMKEAEYPRISAPKNGAVHEMTCGSLRAALRVRYACNPSDSRHTLGGVCFDSRCGQLYTCGADGRFLAVFNSGDSTLQEGRWLVPEASAGRISRCLPEADSATCSLQFDDNKCFVRAPGIEMECRLLEGRFPPYEKIGIDAHASVVVATRDLANACRGAAISSEVDSKYSNKYAMFALHDGYLTVTAKGESGESESTIPVTYKGPRVAAYMGIPFVAEFLAQCTGHDDVEIEIRDDDGHARIKAGQNFHTIIQQAVKP